jgi:predicted homoserine dehydrogenase-like protein
MIVDRELEQREAAGQPVRVALVGAGYMGRGVARQLAKPVSGMRVVAIVNRTIAGARRAFEDAGVGSVLRCESSAEFTRAIERGRPAIGEDVEALCGAGPVDVVVEATGEVDFGARVALEAIRNGKHVALLNAELDATLGPILKTYADSAGVVITNVDGDEPGVAMNLVRFARMIGYEPVCAGNIKGMIDRYRNPDTQREFAERVKQNPALITSFADGTKLSMEATVLANAAGFGVAQRGMVGHDLDHVKDLLDVYRPDDFAAGGLVDYTIGAEPHTGAFVLALEDDPVNAQYMEYFKMGAGPLYCFYTPYHLPHVQIIPTIARAALFADPTVAPLGAPRCDVITMSKRPLEAGETLDGIGGFCAYGIIENTDAAFRSGALPMGLSAGCRVLRDLPIDHVLTYEDVELPHGRLADRLRQEQDERFRAAVLSRAA